MATTKELIAAQKSVPEIREHIAADSLGYLSLDGLIRATEMPAGSFCLACFTGEYPIPVQLSLDKLGLERPGQDNGRDAGIPARDRDPTNPAGEEEDLIPLAVLPEPVAASRGR